MWWHTPVSARRGLPKDGAKAWQGALGTRRRNQQTHVHTCVWHLVKQRGSGPEGLHAPRVLILAGSAQELKQRSIDFGAHLRHGQGEGPERREKAMTNSHLLDERVGMLQPLVACPALRHGPRNILNLTDEIRPVLVHLSSGGKGTHGSARTRSARRNGTPPPLLACVLPAIRTQRPALDRRAPVADTGPDASRHA